MPSRYSIAVPNGFLANGVPMGITFVGPAFSDAFLASFGERFHRQRVATWHRPVLPGPFREVSHPVGQFVCLEFVPVFSFHISLRSQRQNRLIHPRNIGNFATKYN